MALTLNGNMSEPHTNPRDRLRSAVLGSRIELEEKTVEVDGLSFLLIEPNVKDRAAITAAAGITRQRFMKTGETEATVDTARYAVMAIILCTYVPETRERVFQLQDEGDLLKRSSRDKFLSALGEAATDFLKATEEKAKNSEGTTTA